MWFDSHCHLHICEEEADLDVLLAETRAAGVTGLLTCGIDAGSSERSVELTRSDGVYAGVGIHPNSSAGWEDAWLEPIASHASNEKVVAIGETGLDFYRDDAPPDDQVRSFRAHIALAKDLDKALVIHTRASIGEAADVLQEAGPPERFVFHCWSGETAELRRATELGAYVSFAGNVSFASAGALRDVVPQVPRDKLLIETDSPYLSPVPHRGKPNRPAHVVHVGAALADVLSVPLDVVAEQTYQNATRLLAL